MLVIRTEQMQVFEAAAIQAFEERTYTHLQRYFPGHCALLGEEQVRRVIQQGWQKAQAQSYDLTAECCVRSYIEFMCRLGSGFDADPLLPWAAATLNDKTILDQVERGDCLYDRAWDYIDHIAQDYRDASGQPTTARFVGELRSLRHGQDEVLTPGAMPNFCRQLLARIERVFPAKCQYVGADRVRDLIPHGIEAASTYGITTERGVTLFTVLMFVLGSGFADDLLLPWASATLNDKGITNQIHRVDRLYSEGVGCLNRWWGLVPTQGGKNVLG
jgi:hypothetical protein